MATTSGTSNTPKYSITPNGSSTINSISNGWMYRLYVCGNTVFLMRSHLPIERLAAIGCGQVPPAESGLSSLLPKYTAGRGPRHPAGRWARCQSPPFSPVRVCRGSGLCPWRHLARAGVVQDYNTNQSAGG